MQGFGGIKINKNNLKTKKYGGGGFGDYAGALRIYLYM